MARPEKLPFQATHDLWVEWEFGLACNKSENNFTPREWDGKISIIFVAQIFWIQDSEIFQSGRMEQVACDEIDGFMVLIIL